MHGRPIRTSFGSEPYGSALVCTGPQTPLGVIDFNSGYRSGLQLMRVRKLFKGKLEV